jgi:hypothetical protein
MSQLPKAFEKVAKGGLRGKVVIENTKFDSDDSQL